MIIYIIFTLQYGYLIIYDIFLVDELEISQFIYWLGYVLNINYSSMFIIFYIALYRRHKFLNNYCVVSVDYNTIPNLVLLLDKCNSDLNALFEWFVLLHYSIAYMTLITVLLHIGEDDVWTAVISVLDSIISLIIFTFLVEIIKLEVIKIIDSYYPIK